MENKYKSLREFKKAFPSECASLKYKGLINKLCEDMGWNPPKQKKTTKPNGYWTLELCKEEALKYTTKVDWAKKSTSSQQAARKNGWYKECTAHMIELLKPAGYWTKERCMEEALKYDAKSIWAKNSDSTYNSARKNGWFEECTAHMVELQKPGGYWTLERCKEEALKYKTRNEWRENGRNSYQAAMSSKFLIECTSHMEYTRLKSGYWTKEKCLEEALKHNGRFEWQKKSSASYNSARTNGWLDECCTHMKIFFKKKLD